MSGAGQDRIKGLRFAGIRTLGDVRLNLNNGLSVLIGENGAGKSTIVEACALLTNIPSGHFGQRFFQIHSGMGALRRRGAKSIAVEVCVGGGGPDLRYSFELSGGLGAVSVDSEELLRVDRRPTDPGGIVLRRNRADARVFQTGQDDMIVTPQGDEFAVADPAFRTTPDVLRMLSVLGSVDVQVPFGVLPSWVAREKGIDSPMRESTILQRASRLDRLGTNLPNAYWALQNDFGKAHWDETLDVIRLGLGSALEQVVLQPDAAGGSIAIALDYRGWGRVPVVSLSDGQLAFLALVAVYRLQGSRSLLVFDEPDLHLHPRLLRRVVLFFEELALTCPIVITTHSDVLLDALAEPAKSVVLCELDEERATHLRRVDDSALQRWLQDYRGLGDVRSAGHEESVFAEADGG